jgi:hypothetical protein
MAEHGFKMEQKKDNKVDTTGKTPKNKNNRRSRPPAKGKAGMDPAMLAAIVAMLQARGAPGQMGGMPGGDRPGMPPMGPGMGGPPMSLPPGAVPMGPPQGGNPAMQGRMGLMPPMPMSMPPGGQPVR